MCVFHALIIHYSCSYKTLIGTFNSFLDLLFLMHEFMSIWFVHAIGRMDLIFKGKHIYIFNVTDVVFVVQNNFFKEISVVN